MNKVYIIQGVTGENDDYQTWLVKGFLDVKKARKFCNLLTKKYKELEAKVRNPPSQEEDDSKKTIRSHFLWFRRAMDIGINEDPNFRCDHNGTEYRVVILDLEG